jgi:trehalose/maltose hydrolase-like predicted phosphorylase
MFPAVLMFHPQLAKAILEYRINKADAAAENAQLFNLSGWRYIDLLL